MPKKHELEKDVIEAICIRDHKEVLAYSTTE